MTVTLGQAVTEVRALLDETNQAFYSTTQLESWINQGCADVARRAEILWQEYNVTTVPNVQTYPFPSDFLNCHRAEYTINPPIGSPGSLTQVLEFREINSMDENWGMIHSLPAAWPRWFTIRGNPVINFQLMMYPAPAAAGVLTIYYYRQAVFATSSTQNIDTLSGWEDIVYEYAVFKGQRSAHLPEWRDAFGLYESKLMQMINQTRNMTDQMNQVTSGSGNLPSTPTPGMTTGNACLPRSAVVGARSDRRSPLRHQRPADRPVRNHGCRGSQPGRPGSFGSGPVLPTWPLSTATPKPTASSTNRGSPSSRPCTASSRGRPPPSRVSRLLAMASSSSRWPRPPVHRPPERPLGTQEHVAAGTQQLAQGTGEIGVAASLPSWPTWSTSCLSNSRARPVRPPPRGRRTPWGTRRPIREHR